jgi:DNA replicative helicase MCM subunit Mcm2 (Cdc46/Mcm family)
LGGSSTGAGLTAGMVKMYNGTMVLKGGLLPRHTGHPVYIDEGDKMKTVDIMSLFECMEQQSVTSAKGGGSGRKRLVAKNNIIFAGNPKNGKYNPDIPIMENFDMPEPFITRFDILWLAVDKNDEELDDRTRKHIREFESSKEDFMSTEEIQRYFAYVRKLKPTIPDELKPKLDEIHKKMRVLNKNIEGMNIGLRQYYGLYRLVTACASCNLREEVTQEDIDIVYEVIKASLASLRMDIEEGQNDTSFLTAKASKEKIFLEVWNAMTDDNGECDKDDFIAELGRHEPFNPLTASIEFNKRSQAMTLNNGS